MQSRKYLVNSWFNFNTLRHTLIRVSNTAIAGFTVYERKSRFLTKQQNYTTHVEGRQTSRWENCLNKSLSNNLWGFKPGNVPNCALIVRITLCYVLPTQWCSSDWSSYNFFGAKLKMMMHHLIWLKLFCNIYFSQLELNKTNRSRHRRNLCWLKSLKVTRC